MADAPLTDENDYIEPDSEWTGDRRVHGFDSALCIHGVGRTPGLWCGGCHAEAWRREYAPDSTAECVGGGCGLMGPCAEHLTTPPAGGAS